MQNLLFLCHRIPFPPDKGDKIRAYHLLQRLRRRFRVHLGCFVDDKADYAHISKFSAGFDNVACIPINPRQARLRAFARLRPDLPLSVAYFQDTRLSQWVRSTISRNNIDQIVVFSSAMAPYASLVPKVPRLLDMVDIDSEKFAAYAHGTKWPMRAIWAREARTLLAFERAAASEFDHTLFVSKSEHARFLALAPEARGYTGWIGNGVDLRYFDPKNDYLNPFSNKDTPIVFTGAMDYRPNIEAVEWFANEVMPQLSRRRQPPTFYIVGTNPAPSVQALGQRSNVHVTGRVPDTRPYLAHAAVVVAPLRIGRGIQNKVLEALAMAKPVIASLEAFAGIQAIAGRDLLVADGPDDTARLVHDVLDGKYPQLGNHARQTISATYDWEQTLAPLDALVGLTAPCVGADI